MTITEAFRSAGAERKKSRIKKLLKKKVVFESWAREEDAHRKRHDETFFEKRKKQREMAKEFRMAVGILLPDPITTHDIVLEYLVNFPSEMPKEFHPHSKLVKELLVNKVPQPIHGIEQLKKMVDAHVLILKPLDPLMLESLTYKDQDGNEQVSFVLS